MSHVRFPGRYSGRRRSVTAALALVVALGCNAAQEQELETEAEGASDASVLVQVESVSQGKVEETVSAIGQVEFDTTRVRSVPFVEAGEVTDVHVVPGQPVQKGDLIATLGPVPARSLDTQKARMASDFARRELERVQRLREEKLATNADVQNAEKAAQESGAQLRSMGAGFRRRELRAPESGVIAQIDIAPGALVQVGQTAFSLAPPDALAVRVGFDPEDAARLRGRLAVALTPLFTRGEAESVEAEISRLPSVINPATQQAEALIRVTDPRARMFAGERVRVTVAPESNEEALVVPRAALTQREGKEGVFVVDGEQAHWHELEIGLRGEDTVEARSGVEVGDAVVVAGHSSLEDATHIRVETVDVGAAGKEGAEDEPASAEDEDKSAKDGDKSATDEDKSTEDDDGDEDAKAGAHDAPVNHDGGPAANSAAHPDARGADHRAKARESE